MAENNLWYKKAWLIALAVVISLGSIVSLFHNRDASLYDLPSVEHQTDLPNTDSVLLTLLGTNLGHAIEILTEQDIKYTTKDLIYDRSVWAPENWTVLEAEMIENTALLGVVRIDDPKCWEGAVNCEWRTVFTYEARKENIESEQFILEGGPVRIKYQVQASAQKDGFRVGQIYFQNAALHTEASYVDTIIYIEKPGEGVEEVGSKSGSFFIWIGIVSGVVDPDFEIVVEELKSKDSM